eukprot:Nk52_evm42s292 gene=Nk52_evmTU42s292
MPTVGVKKEFLFQKLGRSFTDDEFFDLCFDFGVELDEITSEKTMMEKEQGKIAGAGFSDEVIYKIDVPANRYDLLCAEGIASALLIFLGKAKCPNFHAVENPSGERVKLYMKPDVKKVRPHVVAAVLRNVTFTKESYDSFIDLQDKLHQNICRKRTLVSIGTHDLDSVKGPFYYDAKPPASIRFQALSQDKVTTAPELMEMYRAHSQLKQYLHIIQDKPVYPLILDSNDIVMSMPPIINGEHSKITLNTKNVFIECASNDLTKAKVVLNTVVAMFSEYCKDKYSYEPVDVIEVDGTTHTYPDMEERVENVEVDYINRRVGIDISPDEISSLLTKMSLASKLAEDRKSVYVTVPCTRSDVLHPCDIMEDVAIAYGYNNLVKSIPKTNTVGQQFPLNRLSDLLRLECANSGYTEALTFSLLSTDELYTYMRKKMPEEIRDATPENLKSIRLANPKTAEYQVARTSLIPGLLKTIASNRRMPLPLKLFEISDIVYQCESADVGAKNQRNFGAVYYGKTSGLEGTHGLLDRMMQVLEVKRGPVDGKTGYYVKPGTNPSFFQGRSADIFVNGNYIGVMGVLHPETLANFELNMACSAFEFTIEPFL